MSLLKLDPRYDVAFPCPKCAFVARGPGALEDHMNEHGVVPESVAAVPVDVVAGPVTESVVPVKTPKTFRCSACGEKVVGYGEFMRHKRLEKRGVAHGETRISNPDHR